MTRAAMLRLLGVWLVLALLVGRTEALSGLPVPPPFVAVGLTIVLLLVLRTSKQMQRGATAFDTRVLVAFHGIRLPIGAYFLVLQARGTLPAAFATPAGWGDIVVGAAALAVAAFCCPVTTGRRRSAVLVWNVAGLLDILGVLVNGIRLFGANPEAAAPFVTLPLSLLPTFIVPLVIVSHVVLFGSARRRA